MPRLTGKNLPPPASPRRTAARREGCVSPRPAIREMAVSELFALCRKGKVICFFFFFLEGAGVVFAGCLFVKVPFDKVNLTEVLFFPLCA